MVPQQLTCFKSIKTLLFSDNFYSFQRRLRVLCEEGTLWSLGNLALALFLPLVALLMQNQKKEFH